MNRISYILVSFFIASISLAETSVNFIATWNPVTQNTDGSEASIAEYKVFESGALVGTSPEGILEFTWTDFSKPRLEFRVAAVRADGVESDFSEPVFVDLSIPLKPEGLNLRKNVVITW